MGSRVCIYDKISTNYPPDINEAIKHLSIPAKYKTIINNILKEYKNEKKSQNLIDFNDLMIQFCQLLGTKKIAEFINNIKYVFFDEYQDINPVQNYILSCFGRSPNSNIMVVGDDAQAIYAFRGSSVQYIWEFKKNFENVKTYYLETNYRSTPSIVNYFQDIISHNVNQFTKNVKSNQTENGLKPYIMCHNTNIEQYKWVADDIAKKYKSGISLREMVVLSRKNSSLDMLEHELLAHSIPVIKSIGISLLNKQHIKDFIAFLIIITNPKSIIHWKRVLALHKGIGIARANEIVENVETNVIEAIEEFIEDNPSITSLNSLNDFLKSLKNKQIKEQIHMIQFYLINLWEINNTSYKADSGDAVYRRSLYVIIKRSVPNPTLSTFDAPSRSYCIARRQRTNTPLQALVTLNDPTFVEAEKIMGEQIATASDNKKGITAVYRKLTGLIPSKSELQLLENIQSSELKKMRADINKTKGWLSAGQYIVNKDIEPALIAANAVVASVILNSDATLTKR